MDDLINDFIAETREGLEALDSELVRFEQQPEDPELLGGIFRLIHTIKGTCGFLGLMRLQTVAHSAENLLGAFRDGELAVTPDAVTAILETVDLIRSLVDALATSGAEPAGDDSALISRLEGILAGGGAVNADAAGPEPEPEVEPARAATLIDRVGGDATLDSACEMLMPGLQAAGLVAGEPDEIQSTLRDGLCAMVRGQAAPGALRDRFAGLLPAAQIPAMLDAVQGALGHALMELDVPPSAAEAVVALVAPVAAADAASQDMSAEAVDIDEMVVEPAPPPAAEAPVADTRPPEKSAAPVAEAGGEPQAAQTIRVSVDALEHLMTVVSELVLIRNQLIQTLRLEPESPFAAPLNRLNQVTSELQEGVMTTRMQPISGAWAKLPRLVRDLAQDLGKKIDLVMAGQETELDRQVLELIKDPLTHMIRNAADHGLETPDERRAAGKSEAGRISLSARHEGGAIVIEVSDDGRGLPAAKIRAKALASGLATAAQLDAMSDADVRQFIFAAGFSTAGEVTAVSGRGVGMDVVRTNIEKIGGAIELSSVEGQGTRFTIRIPLTLTIVSALIVECCGERFAMPQSSVVELVSASDASGRQIEQINGAAVLRLRDRLLPLVSLQSLLGLDPELASKGETCIVVAKVGGFSFGVIVDRVFDTEEIVVKPVATVLRHLKLYSGATILGDGSVILILDFKGISAECGAAQAGATQEDADSVGGADEERAAILVFRASNGALKAAPLAAVSRIEEVAFDQVERVDGRLVLQYRGTLMPLLEAEASADEVWDEGERRPLLVFAGQDRAVGLLVREIVDIVESSLTSELSAAGEGSAGSLIINGAATELIDVSHYVRVGSEPRERREAPIGAAAHPAAPTSARAKRLLLVDASPFSQMLLRPMLSQAGYEVTVAAGPDEALALHRGGESFHLIMVDATARGEAARTLAQALGQATRWHATPMLSLGFQGLSQGAAFDEQGVLGAVSDSLEAA